MSPRQLRYAADNILVIQILMEATNGLGIILENRYYGESWPFNTSTTDQLAYLTNQQSSYQVDHPRPEQ